MVCCLFGGFGACCGFDCGYYGWLCCWLWVYWFIVSAGFASCCVCLGVLVFLFRVFGLSACLLFWVRCCFVGFCTCCCFVNSVVYCDSCIHCPTLFAGVLIGVGLT